MIISGNKPVGHRRRSTDGAISIANETVQLMANETVQLMAIKNISQCQ